MRKISIKAILAISLISLIVFMPIQPSNSTIDFEQESIKDAMAEIRGLIIDDLAEIALDYKTANWIHMLYYDFWMQQYYDNFYNYEVGTPGSDPYPLSSVLLDAKVGAMANLGEDLNMTYIYWHLQAYQGGGEGGLFNNWTYGESVQEIMGVGGFTNDAITRMTYGNVSEGLNGIFGGATYKTENSTLGYPWQYSNTSEYEATTYDTPSGFTSFLDKILAANGSQTLNDTMQEDYNVTWTQLDAIYDWVEYYLVPADGVPINMSDAQDVEEAFYAEWANQSLYYGYNYFGMQIEILTGPPFGFLWAPFNGTVDYTKLNLTQCEALWDPTNPLSFVNENGIETWLGAWNSSYTGYNETMAAFNLTADQKNFITLWLMGYDSYTNQINHGVPYLLATGTYDSEKSTFADGIYKQDPVWGALYNGMGTHDYLVASIMTQISDLNGNPAMEWYLGEVRTYGSAVDGINLAWGVTLNPANKFEMVENGFTDGLRIPWKTMDAMFDFFNDSAFTNPVAFRAKWMVAAADDTSDEYTDLKTTWGLTTAQIDGVLDWLVNFRDNYTETLLGTYTETNTGDALIMFYNLWETGNLAGVYHSWGVDRMEPLSYTWAADSFGTDFIEFDLTTYDADILSYFPLNGTGELLWLDGATVASLWRSTTPDSIANDIDLWHAASCGGDESTEYTGLMATFSLTNGQMDAILDWIPIFEEKFGLPTDDCSTPAPIIPGYDIFAILGFIAISVFIISKKKKN